MQNARSMGRSRASRGSSFLVISFILVVIFTACLPLILQKQLTDNDVNDRSIVEDILSGSASRIFQFDRANGTKEKKVVGELFNNGEENLLAGLNCDRWGGPSNDLAEEMVYWEDIPSDSQFISPFYKSEGPTQYFTFEADSAGWNNVRMSMETLLSASLAMGRTLVLPPAQELNMLSSSDDKQTTEFSFSDFFPMESISREHKGFSIITMEEFLQLFLVGKLKNSKSGESMFPPNNRTNWNGCTDKELDVLKEWLRSSSKRLAVNADDCLLSFPKSADPRDIKELIDIKEEIQKEGYPEFQEFLGKPGPVDASPKDRMRENWAARKGLCLYDQSLQEAPWVHFPILRSKEDKSRMLVHFYGFLFFADWRVDLWTKRFVRDHVRYVDEIQCAAARIVNAIRQRVLKRTDGRSKEFDTMHVRRGDFLDQYEDTDATIEEIYEMTAQRIPDMATVYIATDEEDESFFNLLKEHYDVVFLDDFEDELGEINSNFYGMIDQLVASRGRVFFGCGFSTFTGYINRLRGYHADDDRSPGYELGIIPSFYYAPEEHFLRMQTYYPVKRPFWAREFPTSWRLIDTGVTDSRNAEKQ